jgi:uncharacterized protein
MSATFDTLPGVRIKEVRLGSPPIIGVGTSTAAFVGNAPLSDRFKDSPRLVTSADQFFRDFIRDSNPALQDDETKGATTMTPLGNAVLGFFQNGGTECFVVNVGSVKPEDVKAGIERLAKIEEIDIIAAPGSTHTIVYNALRDQAKDTANRFAILDPPTADDVGGDINKLNPGPGSLRPNDSIWAAFYYPRILVPPVLKDDKEALAKKPSLTFPAPPSGHIAGVYARVDGQRGVHKAPANEVLSGVLGVEQLITDSEQNTLNKVGVNIIRQFSAGPTVWGARTLQVAEAPVDSSFLYISVRRLATFVEQSLREGLRFAVFEPNNLALRQTITRSVRGFLDGVWRDGALFGATADEAYYVRFPDAFNTDTEREKGNLTLEVGLRPAPPAEFIIIRIGLLDRPANATT